MMYTFLVLFLALIHISLLIHIVYTKHEESDEATMWLLTVALLPGVGTVLYLFFGITRLHWANNKLKEIASGELARQNHRPAASAQWSALGKFAPESEIANNLVNSTLNQLFPSRPVLDGNSVELLCDGVRAYPRMLEDIKNAKTCIRLESFIINSDKVGAEFLKTLEKKAKEGVDVKILFDSFGSFMLMFSHFFRRYMKHRCKNFTIMAFSPINILTPWKFQLRNHRKLMIVDGSIVYCGGINISEENRRFRSVPRSRYIHDLHCRIEGPVAALYTRSFFSDWAYTMRHHKQYSHSIEGDFPPLEKCGSVALRIIDGGPGENYKGTEKLFFSAAALATRSLHIITPYFVPGTPYIEALIMAAARGVDVRIIIPQNNNHHFVDWASRSYFKTLLRGGVRIFEKCGVFSHTKALLADDKWGFMGSSNCDNRSFKLNFELDFCFEGSDFVSVLSRQFANEFKESKELNLQNILKISKLKELRNDTISLLTPIL